MAGLTAKDKAALSYLYELDEFKAFKKMCLYLREKATKLIVGVNMAEAGSDKIIAQLQGQINALDAISLLWQKIHKAEIEQTVKDHPKR